MTPSKRDVADLMAVALSRVVRSGDFVGVGLGTPLALVAALLARERLHVAVHVLAGGALDVSGDVERWLEEPAEKNGLTPGFVPHFDSMDMAERQAMTLQFLRPAQIDGSGNLNTSRIGPRAAPTARFSGGLATADVPSLLPRIVAYHPDHRRRSLPARVDWITGAGSGWEGSRYTAAGTAALVTNLGVIDFGESVALLASVHPWSSPDEVADNTGFDLEEHPHAPHTAVPSADELKWLGMVDPQRRRDQEIPERDRREIEVSS